MAYKTGFAHGTDGMLLTLKRFLESQYQIDVAYGGGNTGNGYVASEGASDTLATNDEVWTIDFTSATAFTVTGSVDGLQTATGTVGTEYTCDDGEVYFTVFDGTVAWISGDDLTLTVKTGLGSTQKWTVLKWEDGDESPDKNLSIRGPGITGTDAIYCQITPTHDDGAVEPYYNWVLRGSTGWVDGTAYDNQPGARTTPKPVFYSTKEAKMEYWLVASGRRFMLCQDVTDIYNWLYMGFILPYGLPTEYPYPLFVGGQGVYKTDGVDPVGNEWYHRAFWSPPGYDISYNWGPALKHMDGEGDGWLPFANYTRDSDMSGDVGHIWPFNVSDGAAYSSYDSQVFLRNSRPVWGTGKYPIWPCILYRRVPTRGVYGELQGIFAIPGNGGVLQPRDTFTYDSKDYIVLPDVWRRENNNYVALLKE